MLFITALVSSLFPGYPPVKQVFAGMRFASGGRILTVVSSNFYKEPVSCARTADWDLTSCSAATLSSDFFLEGRIFSRLDLAERERRWLGKTQILLDATYTECLT